MIRPARAALAASSAAPETGIALFDQPHFTPRQSLEGRFILPRGPMHRLAFAVTARTTMNAKQ